MNVTDFMTTAEQNELLELAQSLVRIPSLPGQEEQAIRTAQQRMLALGFDEVRLDAMGNLLGRIGSGGKSILFDSHLDVVAVNDPQAWAHPHFGGEIAGGRLHGRGSVDMKSGAAASLYAAALAKRLGLATGKTIYVSCTVFEEDCDGENLKHLFAEFGLRPDYAVICEPSDNRIALGHKGKAQVIIKTHGLSAHGAAPEKGVNAVYAMAEIIQRVEQANLALMQKEPPRGTLVLSRISSVSASLNAVPSECEIYLDRRIAPGETEAAIRQEFDGLVAGKDAAWEWGTLRRTSWTGLPVEYTPFHLAWKIGLEHELTRACQESYQATFGQAPGEYAFWDFSTNAVAPVSLGIPTIGFGPGDPKLAHMRDESCPVDQIVQACRFYLDVMERI